MNDERHQAQNGIEVSPPSNIGRRARLENKPILEWTREDWQLWAGGLNESRYAPVEDQPVHPERVEERTERVEPERVEDPSEPVEEQPGPAQTQQAPEPVPTTVATGADAVTARSVETEEPADQGGSMASEVTAQDRPAEVQEPQSSQQPARVAPALPSSSGPSTTRPWPVRTAKAPVQTARARARSAMGLMMLAVAVGALVAGLVMFIIVVSGLLLQRALGS